MTKTNRNTHRIISLIAAGSVALGAFTFGISTSPGTTRGAGFSTSPGRSLTTESGARVTYHARKGKPALQGTCPICGG